MAKIAKIVTFQKEGGTAVNKLSAEQKHKLNEGLVSAIFGEQRRCRPFIETSEGLVSLDATINEILDSLPNFFNSGNAKTKTPPDRLKRVIKLRFGLEDGRSRTLERVGEVFGVKRERIRQIEGQALRRLRHPFYSRKLRYFFILTAKK